MTQLAGLQVRNTRNVIDENTRLCALAFAPGGFGKTTLSATLNELTIKYMSKPTLFLAVEAGEGGGTMSIRDFGVDFVTPATVDEMERVIAALATDTKYGGIVLDSCTDYVKRAIQPYALKFPNTKDKSPTRDAGVPARSDYQVMGEKLREQLNRIVNLTVHPDLNVRKHFIVTALQREKTDDKGDLIAIQPDLPGAMASTAVAMFQTVLSIAIKARVVPDPEQKGKTKRELERVLLCDSDGIKQVKDRTNRFPHNGPCSFLRVWEDCWLPRLERKEAA